MIVGGKRHTNYIPIMEGVVVIIILILILITMLIHSTIITYNAFCLKKIINTIIKTIEMIKKNKPKRIPSTTRAQKEALKANSAPRLITGGSLPAKRHKTVCTDELEITKRRKEEKDRPKCGQNFT